MFKKHTLKLSKVELEALNWWFQMVIQQQVHRNYYEALLVMVLANCYQKKVHPKMAFIKQETKINLNDREALALGISFLSFDLFDAPEIMQAILHNIKMKMPRLREGEATYFEIPIIAT